MDDLIRRSDAIEAIEEVDWYHQNRNKDMVSGAGAEDLAWYKAEDVYKALEAVPSADRLQGYWTKTDVATYRCSECGKIQIADDVNELNFCCCCGSRNKMRSKDERSRR